MFKRLKTVKDTLIFKFRRYKFRVRIEAILSGKVHSSIIDVCEKHRRIGKTTDLARCVLQDNPSYLVEGTLQQKKYVQDYVSKELDEYVPVVTPEELLRQSPLAYDFVKSRRVRERVKLYVDESVSETQVMSLVNAGYNVRIYLRHYYE